MSKVIRLRTLLVRHFSITNQEAEQMIGQGRVRVNGKATGPSTKLEFWEEVTADGKIVREGFRFSYIKFFKPRGIECTMNREIPGNLPAAFPITEKFHPVGRLDKESEGLLLLTDDGRVFREVAWSDREKEKEYVVTVDRAIDEEFLDRMRNGVVILGKKTRPAKVFAVDDDPATFRIILTQGMNRQIRRMCYKLGYKVERLLRVRIVDLTLGDLKPGEWEPLSEKEIASILPR